MADRAQLLNDPEESLRLALDGRQARMWTAIPAIVTAVDLTKMTVSAQPAIQGVVEGENGVIQYVNLPVLVDVPIVFPGAGGFILTMPIAIGDEVLVAFSSRCIDSWWQNGGVGKPMEARMHDLSDGFAIPGPRSQKKLPGGAISATGAQLRNDAGTASLEISADGKVKVLGNMTVTGNLDVTGTVKSGSVSLGTHVHTGVTSGGSSTGGPV